jgi:L-lactate dehydrogenase
VIASNPVDIMTRAAIDLSGLPPHRVIGSGTILDTARFRYLLSQYFSVDPRSVHAFIIGEHGDSEVAVWSQTNIAGMGLEQFCAHRGCGFNQEARNEIVHQTRDAAYQIIQRKGATYYAVASGLVQIVQAILRDQHTVLSVSSLIDNYYGIHDVCLSLPAAIGRNGIEWVLPMDLAPDEVEGLRLSAKIISSIDWKNREPQPQPA